MLNQTRSPSPSPVSLLPASSLLLRAIIRRAKELLLSSHPAPGGVPGCADRPSLVPPLPIPIYLVLPHLLDRVQEGRGPEGTDLLGNTCPGLKGVCCPPAEPSGPQTQWGEGYGPAGAQPVLAPEPTSVLPDVPLHRSAALLTCLPATQPSESHQNMGTGAGGVEDRAIRWHGEHRAREEVGQCHYSPAAAFRDGFPVPSRPRLSVCSQAWDCTR